MKTRSPATPSRRDRSRLKTLPLDGMRVLVGRARHQASALSAELRKHGARVVEIPFLEIRKPQSFVPLDRALRDLANYHWLILTSVNGVDAMWARMRQLRITNRELAHLSVAAIGPATRTAIEKQGVRVAVVPEEYVAESVVQSLKGQVQGKRILLVRARVARDVIPRELRKVGARVEVVEGYETVVPKSSRTRLRAILKSENGPSIITFTSSSSARNFVVLLGRKRPVLEGVTLASIGPVTSSTLRELGLRADIEAKQFTIPGLVDAIVSSTRG